MRKRKEITKEWLKTLGITDVTKEGKIYIKDALAKEYLAVCRHKHGKDKKYPIIVVYDPELYKEQIARDSYRPGVRQILVSRVVYAWFNDVCPAEYDVDHIDNNPFNNTIYNLQLLTRKENLARRLQRNQVTCHMSDDELIKYNTEKSKHTKIVSECQAKIKQINKELSKLKTDFDYYTQVCKKVDQYKLLKEVRKEYISKIKTKEEELKECREEWHAACHALKDIKKEYLNK